MRSTETQKSLAAGVAESGPASSSTSSPRGRAGNAVGRRSRTRSLSARRLERSSTSSTRPATVKLVARGWIVREVRSRTSTSRRPAGLALVASRSRPETASTRSRASAPTSPSRTVPRQASAAAQDRRWRACADRRRGRARRRRRTPGGRPGRPRAQRCGRLPHGDDPGHALRIHDRELHRAIRLRAPSRKTSPSGRRSNW